MAISVFPTTQFMLPGERLIKLDSDPEFQNLGNEVRGSFLNGDGTSALLIAQATGSISHTKFTATLGLNFTTNGFNPRDVDVSSGIIMQFRDGSHTRHANSLYFADSTAQFEQIGDLPIKVTSDWQCIDFKSIAVTMTVTFPGSDDRQTVFCYAWIHDIAFEDTPGAVGTTVINYWNGHTRQEAYPNNPIPVRKRKRRFTYKPISLMSLAGKRDESSRDDGPPRGRRMWDFEEFDPHPPEQRGGEELFPPSTSDAGVHQIG